MGDFFVPHNLRVPLKGAPNGPLAGLSVAVKDMYDIEGERTGGGSPDWLAAQSTAEKNAAAVQLLLDAGATLIGKTICDEFFYSVAGANAHYGTPSNLRAPGRLPGGSSSGSAPATAANVCDIGLGSDTGGSVRVPASFCGLYGIRTSRGRVDPTGAMVMAPSFDTIGWMAGSPGIFRRVGGVLLEGAGADAPVSQVIILDDAFAEADEPVAALLHKALTRMKSVLPDFRHERIAPNGLDSWRETFRVIQAYEVWQVFGRFIREKSPALGPGIAERMQIASAVTAAQADAARRVQANASELIIEKISSGTVAVLPSAPCVAPRVDTSAEGLDSFRLRTIRLTCIAGLAGLPQVSIPVGTVSGGPVGLSFIGWSGSDEVLLDLAFALAPFLGIEL
jgi:amidase